MVKAMYGCTRSSCMRPKLATPNVSGRMRSTRPWGRFCRRTCSSRPPSAPTGPPPRPARLLPCSTAFSPPRHSVRLEQGLPIPAAKRMMPPLLSHPFGRTVQFAIQAEPDTFRMATQGVHTASGACFGNKTGETGMRCAPPWGCNASAAPATVSQCGCITVNQRFTSHCDMTWRPDGRARMTWEGDAARLASPETGLLHSCCPSHRYSVCNGSSAGMRRMTAMRRPQVVADHLCACRRSF